jgi:hypothetical protein
LIEEASVTEKTQVLVVSCIGAVAGAAMAYIFFTRPGQKLRASFEPALEDFARELNQFRGTVTKAAGAAGEGWKLINEVLVDAEGPAARFPTPRQTSPF